MGLIEYLKPFILAGGFLFILVGMNILMIEQPTYYDVLFGLYTLILWAFYLYLVLVFLSILIAVLDALLKSRFKRT